MMSLETLIHGVILAVVVVLVVALLVWMSNDTRVFQTLGGMNLQGT